MSSDADSDMSDTDVQYGIRRSRRNTSHQYRDSSSLNPGDRMEQEVYYENAEISVEESLIIMHMIVLLSALHLRASSILRNLQNMNGIQSVLDYFRNMINSIKIKIDRLFLVVSFLRAHGELALLRAEDLTVYIRRRNRFRPKSYRLLQDLTRQNCYDWYGLSPHSLRRLFSKWRVPDQFRSRSRHVYSGEECFLIFMYHMIKADPFTAMAKNIFGGDPRDYSKMCEMMIEHLYTNFYNKISGDSLAQWLPAHLDRCRSLIHNALANGAIWERQVVNGQVVDEAWIVHHFDYNTFRIFGFLDDMAARTARPGDSARRRLHFNHDIQRAFYSGYVRKHGLKAQVVFLPIGIIGSVFVTELRQNDNGVQNISGLNNYLLQLLSGILIGGLLPCLYCDGIFSLLATILPRFTNPSEEEKLLNMRLAGIREIIEHVFSDHHIRFKIFQVPDRLQLFNHGVRVRKMLLMSFFILNCYYCLEGTRSSYFGQIPPTLDDYLPDNEVLIPPPAVDLGVVWDFSHNHNDHN